MMNIEDMSDTMRLAGSGRSQEAVRTGFLEVQHRLIKSSWRRRYVVADSAHGALTIFEGEGSTSASASVRFSGARLVPDSSARPRDCFEIVDAHGAHHTFQAPSPQQHSAWVEFLGDAIGVIRDRSGTDSDVISSPVHSPSPPAIVSPAGSPVEGDMRRRSSGGFNPDTFRIVGAVIQADHIEYVIRYESSGRDWRVQRRYSAFYDMHGRLKREAPDAGHRPHLTGKGFSPVRDLTPEFVAERREKLERYMREVLSHPKFSACPAVQAFLQNGAEQVQESPVVYRRPEHNSQSSLL